MGNKFAELKRQLQEKMQQEQTIPVTHDPNAVLEGLQNTFPQRQPQIPEGFVPQADPRQHPDSYYRPTIEERKPPQAPVVPDTSEYDKIAFKLINDKLKRQRGE